MYDARRTLGALFVQEVRDQFGARVFCTLICHDVYLAEAPAFGLTVLEHAPASLGARAFKALAAEVIARVET